MQATTFDFLKDKPIGVLCNDDARVTGILHSLNKSSGCLTIKNAIKFINSFQIKCAYLDIKKEQIRDLCFFPSKDELTKYPKNFNFKNSNLPPEDEPQVNINFNVGINKNAQPIDLQATFNRGYNSEAELNKGFKDASINSNHFDTNDTSKSIKNKGTLYNNYNPRLHKNNQLKQNKENNIDNQAPFKFKNENIKKNGSKRNSKNIEWFNASFPTHSDFDMSAHLSLFQKEEEFRKIKESDPIDPKDRLVYFNRLPKEEDKIKNLPKPNNLKYNEMVLNNQQQINNNVNKLGLFTESGIYVPTVNKEAMTKIESVAINELGATKLQFYENGGRSIALMAIKAIGGTRRLRPDNHNTPPIIIILVGNNKFGIYSLCAARHLQARNCEVICFKTDNKNQVKDKEFNQQYQFAKLGGVKMINQIRDLPDCLNHPSDLIIDGLLGYENSLASIPKDLERVITCDIIDWANSSQAPVLSVDIPAGLIVDQVESGLSPITNYIRPKWTLSLGVPKEIVLNRNMIGDLYLADIGLPNQVFKKVKLDDWQSPFGAAYVIRLDIIVK